MGIFEGYVGIRLWDGQMMDDVIFTMLFVLFVLFAIMFHSNFRLFVKMLRDFAFIKERQSFFEKPVGSEWLFRNFMTFQTLFLCSISLFAIARAYGYINYQKESSVLILIGFIFVVLLLFYQFKQFLYLLFGSVFADPARYKFWKTNYSATFGTWGVFLYVPVLWLIFIGSTIRIAVILFVISYILCRLVIIYKTIRIFYGKSAGFLYISLYLCGQEILPLIFLYEGMFYLYNFIETSTLLWH